MAKQTIGLDAIKRCDGCGIYTENGECDCHDTGTGNRPNPKEVVGLSFDDLRKLDASTRDYWIDVCLDMIVYSEHTDRNEIAAAIRNLRELKRIADVK